VKTGWVSSTETFDGILLTERSSFVKGLVSMGRLTLFSVVALRLAYVLKELTEASGQSNDPNCVGFISFGCLLRVRI
jgi:hypothetical protein